MEVWFYEDSVYHLSDNDVSRLGLKICGCASVSDETAKRAPLYHTKHPVTGGGYWKNHLPC